MKKQKQFDCVHMKWKIQQEIEKKYAGVSDAEAYRIQMEEVSKNPIIGPFLKRVASLKKKAAQIQMKQPKVKMYIINITDKYYMQ